MKRGDGLQRTVGLARGAALVTRKSLTRSSGMPRAARSQPRQAPKKPSRSTDIPQDARDAVAARSQGHCEIGAPGCTGQATDIHHRVRRRDGGHAVENLLHVCRRDHRTAHDRPELARAFGWIVSAWAEPATAPLMLRGERWVLLGDRYIDTEAPS